VDQAPEPWRLTSAKSRLEVDSVYLLAPVIEYWIITGTVRQQAIAEISRCSLVSARLVAILYALEHGRTAHVYAALTNRKTLSAIKKGTFCCGIGVCRCLLRNRKRRDRVTVFFGQSACPFGKKLAASLGSDCDIQVPTALSLAPFRPPQGHYYSR
jgi:hypothetical protein